MASNSFGQIFRVTTWGESHGKAIGVVVDGCPAGIKIDEEIIQTDLQRRSPGKTAYTSPRKESDHAKILSGTLQGHTTGAPICILIENGDADSRHYEPIKQILRPGHANFTYLEKYGIFDYRGGGRASARETACRVAAGAIAKQFLLQHHIDIASYIIQIGSIKASPSTEQVDDLRKLTGGSEIYCPDPVASQQMKQQLEILMQEGDSVGGIVQFSTSTLPSGLGEPVYDKLEAKLAYAMLSLPAAKGFEVGSGFASCEMRGSEHNDRFVEQDGKVKTETNHAGGILGGISTGMPIIGRVAFKPASSIKKEQQSLTTSREHATLQLPKGSRHDPCVAIRAVPVVEAMVALVLADALLLNRCSKANYE